MDTTDDAGTTADQAGQNTGADREGIVNAAHDALADAGPHDDVYGEVSRAAGLSRAAVTDAFPAEHDLLLAVLELRDARAEQIMAGPDDPGVDQLRGVVRLVEHNATTPGLVALHCRLSAEATVADHPAHAYYAERYEAVIAGTAEIFQRMADSGELADGVEPTAAAHALIAVLDGVQLQWLIDPAGVDMAAVARKHLTTLLPAGTSL
ncbi:TetR/AcrR family transcriptional regulator [Microbacteriaceae bacterium 4G12]